MHLRNVVDTDRDALFKLNSQPSIREMCFSGSALSRAEHDEWWLAIEVDYQNAWVICEAGRVVGFLRVTCRTNEDCQIRNTYTIRNFAVCDAYRRRGIGKTLLAWCVSTYGRQCVPHSSGMNQLQQQDLACLVAYTKLKNKPMQTLLASWGFLSLENASLQTLATRKLISTDWHTWINQLDLFPSCPPVCCGFIFYPKHPPYPAMAGACSN